jgi:hypothetical protein
MSAGNLTWPLNKKENLFYCSSNGFPFLSSESAATKTNFAWAAANRAMGTRYGEQLT